MRALQACMEMQAAVLTEFTQVLDQEALAMGEGRFGDLPPLIARKSELARQLGELDQERQSLQRSASSTALEEEPAWQLLRALASQARQANQRNGQMVHTLLDFTRQALASLQGQQRSLYGSDGRPSAGTTGRTLAAG